MLQSFYSQHKVRQLEAEAGAEKASFNKQLADLQKQNSDLLTRLNVATEQQATLRTQNSDLLAKLNATTEQLATQSSATQKKLDEILQQRR